MTPIDHNAVVDAIARHFPDGFTPDDSSASVIRSDMGLRQDEGQLGLTIEMLKAQGRLRWTEHGFLVLSHAEHARRIVAAWYGFEEFEVNPEECALDIAMIANVLAGKTEKKA